MSNGNNNGIIIQGKVPHIFVQLNQITNDKPLFPWRELFVVDTGATQSFISSKMLLKQNILIVHEDKSIEIKGGFKLEGAEEKKKTAGVQGEFSYVKYMGFVFEFNAINRDTGKYEKRYCAKPFCLSETENVLGADQREEANVAYNEETQELVIKDSWWANDPRRYRDIFPPHQEPSDSIPGEPQEEPKESPKKEPSDSIPGEPQEELKESPTEKPNDFTPEWEKKLPWWKWPKNPLDER